MTKKTQQTAMDWFLSTLIILATIVIVVVTGTVGASAQNTLRAAKPIDQQKLNQAKKLESDHRSGKLSKSDAALFEQAVRRARGQIQSQRPGGLVSGGEAGACYCTATCQTIVLANGTSYDWQGTGTVSSPSACADAAQNFCGKAFSTWLKGWNCKPL